MILVLYKICYNPRSSSKSTRASTTSAEVTEVDQRYHGARKEAFKFPANVALRSRNQNLLYSNRCQPTGTFRVSPAIPYVHSVEIIHCAAAIPYPTHLTLFPLPEVRPPNSACPCLSYSTNQMPFLFHRSVAFLIPRLNVKLVFLIPLTDCFSYSALWLSFLFRKEFQHYEVVS